jgi:hypothetical protein
MRTSITRTSTVFAIAAAFVGGVASPISAQETSNPVSQQDANKPIQMGGKTIPENQVQRPNRAASYIRMMEDFGILNRQRDANGVYIIDPDEQKEFWAEVGQHDVVLPPDVWAKIYSTGLSAFHKVDELDAEWRKINEREDPGSKTALAALDAHDKAVSIVYGNAIHAIRDSLPPDTLAHLDRYIDNQYGGVTFIQAPDAKPVPQRTHGTGPQGE